MKKSILLGIVSVAIFTCLMYLASAQFMPSYYQLQQSAQQTIDIIAGTLTPFFLVLLGTQNDQYIFTKVLLVALMFIVIYFVLERTKIFATNKAARFVGSIIIAILAIRYLPENDLILGILLPYSVLGIALMTFIPFLVYFYFVHESVPGGFGRRMAWAVYGIAFIALIFLRQGEISSVSSWIYWTGILLVVLSFFFDKTIHGYFRTHELGKYTREIDKEEEIRLKKNYKDAKYVGDEKAAEKYKIDLLRMGIKIEG